MKNAVAVITFSVCILAKLESGYTIQCYQCNATSPGCGRENVMSKSFLKNCPQNILECVRYHAGTTVHDCLTAVGENACYSDQKCYRCVINGCNN